MAVLHALERFTAMVGHALGQRNASVLHSSYFAGGLGKLLTKLVFQCFVHV